MRKVACGLEKGGGWCTGSSEVEGRIATSLVLV